MANSYVQNIKYPEKDEALEVMEYERTQQENDVRTEKHFLKENLTRNHRNLESPI